MSTSTEEIYKALGLFLEGIRPYIVSLMVKEFGADEWEAKYIETLYDSQRPFWHQQRDRGQSPESLIDFQNLKGFAIKYKELLQIDFGREKNTFQLGSTRSKTLEINVPTTRKLPM